MELVESINLGKGFRAVLLLFTTQKICRTRPLKKWSLSKYNLPLWTMEVLSYQLYLIDL